MNEEIQKLIFQTIDETISCEEFDRLQDLIASDEEVRADYISAVNLCESLTEISQHGSEIARSSQLGIETSPSGKVPIVKSVSPTLTGLGSGFKWILAIAAALLAGLGFNFYLNSPSAPSIADSAPRIIERIVGNPTIASKPAAEPLYVAQVVSMTPDVVWSEKSAIPDFLLRARKGDRFEILTGLVEIEYYSGALVILHGPCTFVTSSEKTGRLEKGQLTGKVEGGDFLVTTPSATVLDLGTEFGVAVNDQSDTEVCVFAGEVEVASDPYAGTCALPVSLTEGMSARVRRVGTVDRVEYVDTKQFARAIPETLFKTKNQLSLVDLLSATSDNRFRLAGVIAPDTGKPDQQPWLKPDGPGHRLSNGLHVTAWHPYVDSVFIPSESGIGVRLDSVGHQVDLPQSKGRSWGPIWSRRKIEGAASLDSSDDYWGTLTLEGVIKRLKHCQTGMIGIHSNVGVTFDLEAVRKTGDNPIEFSCLVGNLDNSAVKVANNSAWLATRRFSADLRVFVDGELRASRLDFSRADGEMRLSVELSDNDSFLTLVSSDVDHDGFDHVVVIDPVLNLKL